MGPERRAAVRVLVVDDCRDTSFFLDELLGERGKGYSVRVVNDPRSVPSIVRDYGPHAVVMDTQMPYLEGPEVAMGLKDEGYPGLVLGMSGSCPITFPDVPGRWLNAARANAYLVKGKCFYDLADRVTYEIDQAIASGVVNLNENSGVFKLTDAKPYLE